MTNEQAKSELMQIYMSLSEEKKQALDVLMAQADGEYIRRSDVIKAVDKHTIDTSEIVLDEDITVILEELPSVAIPSAEPCEDAINRQALLDAFGFSEKTRKWGGDHSGYNTMMLYEIQDIIESQPPVKPQEPKTEQFAKWVASEIFDEWEYNKDTFAEIACRKLEKLGIVREKDGEWELVEPQESEDKE